MKTTLIKCNHAVVVYSTSVSLCGVTVRDIAHNNTGLWLPGWCTCSAWAWPKSKTGGGGRSPGCQPKSHGLCRHPHVLEIRRVSVLFPFFLSVVCDEVSPDPPLYISSLRLLQYTLSTTRLLAHRVSFCTPVRT